MMQEITFLIIFSAFITTLHKSFHGIRVIKRELVRVKTKNSFLSPTPIPLFLKARPRKERGWYGIRVRVKGKIFMNEQWQ